MPAFGAKDILVRPYVGGVPTTLTGLRTKQIKINNDLVDVTNADSVNQWRELLAGVGLRSMEVTGSGVPQTGAIKIPGVGALSPPTRSVVVAAGADAMIGPFTAAYTDANNNVNLAYSAVSSVTVGAFRLPSQSH